MISASRHDKNQFWKYVSSFLVLLLSAILLLILCACFPAQRVNQRVKQSAVILVQQGDYPALSDMSDASVLDNFTDATMLMECMSMHISDISTILTNPKYIYADTMVESLLQYTENETEEPTSYYARYWMGFRAILRPALTFLSYQEILLYHSFILFLLFSAVIISLTKHSCPCAAITFAISFILVRPHIICNSLQFSNCFLIAFTAMLLVPYVSKARSRFHLFFWQIGIVTMYFDFYTTPLITYALPAIYLWLLTHEEEDSMKTRDFFSTFAVWMAGYVLMWLAKLVLVDVFTGVSGLKTGLSAMGNWTIRPVEGKSITPVTTFYRIAAAIVADREGACIWGIAILSTLLFLVKSKHDRMRYSKNIRTNKDLLIVTIYVFLWFLVTYKPTAVHYYFQYRSITVVYWSLMLLVFYRQNNKTHLREYPFTTTAPHTEG